ncbi:alpha/beta hydrolase fold domain-containing protein [Nanchangia anserum]|uniref:Alpha/beta hydrolase fold domain-containing protein n=1 Tax=Nanchangia anserum TaxID=2692125 RepID=A0A8I0KNV9_9ACTO|nr:alpha/beta hydrolase fold domain-containing protein [Nanchangia anserum]MBD3689706.1 alpha/beta hydrolase fold domain-containing protein [Nanchangia anserum]QOX81880.1 alpha/beta hydrolase fold domain-containing protein [Nanchangia anserum]
MTSFSQRLINSYAATLPYKTQLGLTDDTLWEWATTRKHTLGRARPHLWPYRVGCEVVNHRDAAVGYWEYIPTAGPARPGCILFFHGGSWMFRFSALQAGFVAAIARGSGLRVRVPRYPLLPDATGKEFREGIMAAWQDCLADGMDPRDIVVMGDSAGGHASLVLYQMLRAQEQVQPARYIVLSAPMDFVTPPDPDTLALEAEDPVIALGSTPVLGRQLAGGLPLDDPRVSPRLGEYDGCPPIDLFVGEHEVLKTASVSLAREWGERAPVRVHVGRGCIHDWPTFPTREGRVARAAILDLLNASPHDA